MEPRVSLKLRDPHRTFVPGDELECHCQVDAESPGEIQAIEASVLWFTEGKGDEDMAVHCFLRRVPADAPDGDLRSPFDFRTRLPNSPLTYVGVIVKIRWCVRLRAFLRRGREATVETPFVLGAVPASTAVESPQSNVVGAVRVDRAAKRAERLAATATGGQDNGQNDGQATSQASGPTSASPAADAASGAEH